MKAIIIEAIAALGDVDTLQTLLMHYPMSNHKKLIVSAARYNNTETLTYLANDYDNDEVLVYAITSSSEMGAIDTFRVLESMVTDPPYDELLYGLCASGEVETVNELLSVHAFSSQGYRNALDNAVDHRKTDIIELFANMEIIPLEDVFQIAIIRNDTDIMRFLLEHGVNPLGGERDGRPLHTASQFGCTESVDMLLDYGADMSLKYHQTALFDTVSAGYFDVIKLLVEKGKVDINIKCWDEQRTALHLSAQRSIDITEYLIEHGADINARDAANLTPLFYAAASERLDTIEALLKAGADTTVQASDGATAYDIAKETKNEYCILLFEKYANQ